MIAVERLVEGPKPAEPELLVANDHKIEELTKANIKNVVSYVSQSFRARANYGRTLLVLTSGDLPNFSELGYRPRTFRATDPQKAQQIVWETMKNFGLDENKHNPPRIEPSYRSQTELELIDYPSQTIKGLSFQRTKEYYRNGNRIISIRWDAVPHVAMFKFNPVEALLKRKQSTK